MPLLRGSSKALRSAATRKRRLEDKEDAEEERREPPLEHRKAMSLLQVTLEEVSKHNSMKSLWFVVGNKVYDVTKFVDEHPECCEVLLEHAGKDATEAFETIGHSIAARAVKEEYLVGEIVEMPSASFFLRDDTSMSDTAGRSDKDDRTPKPARRSKKMRRLEMENGDVDDEARELAFENMKTPASSTSSSGRPRARDSPCQVLSKTSSYATPLSRAKKEKEKDVEIDEILHLEVRTLTPVRLLPPPEKSAMKRKERVEKSVRSIRFAHCHVFLFGREQGYTCVPSHGEVCLGMEARHHDEERHSLDGNDETVEGVEQGGAMEVAEEELSEGEIQPLVRVPRLPAQSSPRRLPPGEKYTTRHIEPLTSKQRSRMLKTSGVKVAREHIAEHDLIRQQRRECGCSCEGGRCRPETCECAKNGIPCQVDTDDGPFPCRCRADTCQNDQGRVEFNAQHVYEHSQRTFARLRLCEQRGDDTLGSPSLIRFTDEDEAPRHNATSYLETPPPAIYQSPTVSTTMPAGLKFVTPSTQLCTPPMQKNGERAATSATGEESAAPPHTRFPVTPVYKKYAGSGERPSKELPLSRMAIFKAASTSVPTVVTANTPRSVTIADDNLDESMDTSEYATPPEGRSPDTIIVAAVPLEALVSSPRKFASFQSLI